MKKEMTLHEAHRTLKALGKLRTPNATISTNVSKARLLLGAQKTIELCEEEFVEKMQKNALNVTKKVAFLDVTKAIQDANHKSGISDVLHKISKAKLCLSELVKAKEEQDAYAYEYECTLENIESHIQRAETDAYYSATVIPTKKDLTKDVYDAKVTINTLEATLSRLNYETKVVIELDDSLAEALGV